MKHIDLTAVESADNFKKLIPGGYVCKIMKVENDEKQEYLKFEYDIAEGNFKDHYMNLYSAMGFWGGKFVKSYANKALPYFKSFIEAVMSTNRGYVWNDDERTLVNKGIGLVLGEREYKANDGSVKIQLYVAEIIAVKDIRDGSFTIPELKPLTADNGNKTLFGSLKPIDTKEELPF